MKCFLSSLAKTGNVSLSCSKAKIVRSVPYDRRSNYAEFAKQWDEAVETAADVLEAEAWRRSVDGTLRPVFYEGVICGHVREYSDTLMSLLLKGHKPAKFRERVSQEVSGVNGAPLSVVIELPPNGR